MSVNTDQAIFDAIAAAISRARHFDATHMELVIDTKAFIDTFNSHRDRKLCTSLDLPSSAPTTHASLPSGESDPSVTSGFVGAGTAHSPLEAALRAIINAAAQSRDRGTEQLLDCDDIKDVLRAIAEGYPCHGYMDRYIVVENPAFKPDNGSDPNLVLDTWSPDPAQAAPKSALCADCIACGCKKDCTP